MKKAKTIVVKVERLLPATPGEVYDAWLNPKVPGNPWYDGNKLLFNPKVDGLFYWHISGTPHYGRFTKLARGSRIQHTWMSPYTHGDETTVNITFKKKGKETLMTLVHTGLPNDKNGKGHNHGWNFFMDKLAKKFSR